jgi:hypothetical protein
VEEAKMRDELILEHLAEEKERHPEKAEELEQMI